MKIISSELYVKDNKVYHEGNKPKPKDIGAAPETHTHNYASATTPGGSAEHAIKATEDSLGQRIDTYIKGLSVSGRTITYTRGDGTTGTIITQDTNTDTKVTNTLNTTAKAYITGTTDSATNTGTQVFDINVYLDTTAGMLTATTFKGALQGNATTATSATSASHAAKLTTPRSINGTNFDGTAAITTANWGTARTLTIGNTGKSVNGSGNVSWSIGEIGAAPTVHNHTSLTGITNLSFAAEGTDSASITTTVEGANTYFDFNLSDDPSQEDMWRWRFRPSGANVFNAMTLDAISTTEAKLAVTGEVQATRLKGTLTGDVKGNVTGTVSGNAGSATKLATARTINGTNFDGTAAITTANWGTARTLTVGSASKSVNGSANVTWSLDEIGARTRIKKVIDLSNTTTYPVDKWYPCLATIPYDGMHDIEVAVQLNSGVRPSWSTHQSGFTCNLHVKAIAGGWGTTVADSIVLNHSYNFASANPCSYSQLNNSSNAVLWLRGGGKYFVFTDWNASWSVKTASTEISSQTVAPATSCPNISLTRSTMIANLSGNASTATTLQTARTINGTSFNGSGNITTANWGTARNLNGVSVNGSTNCTIPVENYYCNVGDNNTNLYHRILTTDIATTNSVDKSLIIVMHSGYSGGGFGIAKITFRTNDISSAANSQGEIKWLVRNGFAANALVFNLVNQAKNACMDVFYKSPGTYAGMTWYVLSEGDRGGAHTKQWTKYNTNATGTNAYTEANMKTLRTYTSTLVSATDAGHVSTANSASTLTTARTINGTSFNGSANITTANWGTARNLQIGNTAKSVNGSANVTWTLSEIGAAPSNHTHSYLPLSGGTLTGSIKFSGGGYNNHAIRMEAGDANGAFIGIGAGGLTVIGSGESTNAVRTALTNGADETMIVASDQNIRFLTGLQNGYDSAKEVSINTSGVINAPQGMTGNASTATKLQTARTINGTSFDGTANITTANWGTARNIQIGNTTKSVNGSGNVSWNLSEIGAAPTSHNHTSLTGVTNIAFAAAASDSASMGIAVSDDKTYFDFNLSDDANADMWRWRFGAWDTSTSSTKTFNAMTLTATSTTAAKLAVSGTVQASTFSGALSGNATTATTLATARTINGTSFNGSANITTANWGTARNIQIGNTAKSVNGSANVSWSLSEIGAAASNHTHGLVNLNSEAFSGGNDLNTYNPTKTWVARTLDSTTNRPAPFYTVVNFGANSNSNFQLAHSYGNSSILYVRGRHDTSGNYTPWAMVYTDKNKPTASQIGAAEASHTHSYLPLSGGTLTGNLTTKGIIYGKNNIALDRGTLWVQGAGGNTTCDYLRFGTNILASNDSKQVYLMDTSGNRATVDCGDLRAAGLKITNTSYPALRFSDNVRIEYDAAGDTLYAAGTKSTHSGLREFQATTCTSTQHAKIAGKKLFIQSGTPSGVATGDVWIQV